MCLIVRFMLTLLAALAVADLARAADRPNNPLGVHLMIRDARTDENIDRHTAWARRVCGPWGYVKIFEYAITPETEGPSESLVKLIRTCYERELIPVLRLGGLIVEGHWQEPVDTPDGSYADIAEAFARVVAGLPRSDECPLYIEVWNEPNLGLEWSGEPTPAEFAKFYVRTARSIRAIGDDRILISPGAMSPGGEYNSLAFLDAVCEAEPEFIDSFDYWATHPYPGGTPPEHNIHDQTTTSQFACIDLWVYEFERLAAHGCDVSKLKVIGTETGYRTGLGGGAYPIIDGERRADYHFRTYRDYWMHWPEVLGMCIWDFSNPFDKQSPNAWVHPDSATDETGWPSRPMRDFEYVAALAKPTSDFACVSGRFIDERTRNGIPGIEVTIEGTDLAFTTDRFGNYILSPLKPESGRDYRLAYRSDSHRDGSTDFRAKPGQNVIHDATLSATSLATLRGRAIDTATSQPLASALVTAEPGHFGTRSTRDGIFVFDQLPHGCYDIAVAQPGYHTHRQVERLLPAGQVTEHTYRLGPGRDVADNLVSNGGFERAEAGARTPLGWDAEGPKQALVLDTKTTYTGDRAQWIEAVGGASVGIIQWTNYSSIEPGHRYRLQCRLRTNGVKAAPGKGATIVGTVVTNPHETLMKIRGRKVLTGDSPWTLITADFTAPADAGRVSLQIDLEAEAGTCWADQAAVYELPSAEGPR